MKSYAVLLCLLYHAHRSPHAERRVRPDGGAPAALLLQDEVGVGEEDVHHVRAAVRRAKPDVRGHGEPRLRSGTVELRHRHGGGGEEKREERRQFSHDSDSLIHRKDAGGCRVGPTSGISTGGTPGCTGEEM